ncbi:MAG: NAD(P)H-dependent oxidoreductase [Proteobacteria bacterium]|nr:NAD(P)H-dependent oxidoreductase [Pseudomonadota bacterium]MBU1688824.1 NAD(P)H-dependent oxidoreductase [Pseudomonadota bacterium]
MGLFTKIMLFTRTFPAIFIYFAVKEQTSTPIAAGIAATYTISYTLLAHKENQETKLDYAMVLFWLVGLVAMVLWQDTAIWLYNDHFTSILYFTFFLVAALSLTRNVEPFTIPFAKRNSAPEVWQTEPFLAINQTMSMIWTGLFLVAFMVSLFPSALFKIIVPIGLMILIGIPLNKKFPAYALRKHQTVPGTAPNSGKTPEDQTTVLPSNVESINQTDEQRQLQARRQGPIQKALIVLGSPRGRHGHTYRLLEKFMEGMAAGGIEQELILLSELTIKPCIGCFSCWVKTPGRCIHQDDMPHLLKKMRSADLIVYAQPLYTFSVPGIMKNFLDRSLPKLEPFLVERPDGSTRHPSRWRESNPERFLLFSVCGFPEISHFAPIVAMYRAMATSGGATIVGEILRTSSESLTFHERYQDRYDHLLASLHQAGRQVAEQGYVSPITEQQIAQPFHGNVDGFRQVANYSWETLLEYEEKKKTKAALPDREDYLRNQPRMLFGGMASKYNPLKAGTLQGVLQFEIIDRDDGQYFFDLSPGKCHLNRGQAARADLKIKTPWEVWRAISSGAISGTEAFQKGLYEAEGDLGLLLKMRAAMQ